MASNRNTTSAKPVRNWLTSPTPPLRPCGKPSRIYNGDHLLEAVSDTHRSRTSQPMPSHPSFTLRAYHAQDLQALVELFSASVHRLPPPGFYHAPTPRPAPP